jgi:hypothetical protein
MCLSYADTHGTLGGSQLAHDVTKLFHKDNQIRVLSNSMLQLIN